MSIPLIRQQFIDIIEQAQDVLGADYYLGYDLQHPDYTDSELIAKDLRLKRQWRRNMLRLKAKGGYHAEGMQDDHDNLDPDAVTVGDVSVLFELLHRPSEIRVFRQKKVVAIKNLINNGSMTNAEKREVVRQFFRDFKTELDQRVTDSGWTP